MTLKSPEDILLLSIFLHLIVKRKEKNNNKVTIFPEFVEIYDLSPYS